MRSSQSEKPTAGIRFSHRGTLAAGQSDHRRPEPLTSFRRNLEDEAGIIIKLTAEGGTVFDQGDRARICNRCNAAVKSGKRISALEARRVRKAKRCRRVYQGYVQGQEF